MRNQTLPHISGNCLLSLFPPPPSVPATIIVLSHSVKRISPLLFDVEVELMWQQSSETSALLHDLTYEYVLTAMPDGTNPSTSEGTSFTTTMMTVSPEFKSHLKIACHDINS